jgi:hypothetical protein
MNKAYSMHERSEIYIKLWSGNLKGRDHLKDLGRDQRIILKWMLNREVWCGLDSCGSG